MKLNLQPALSRFHDSSSLSQTLPAPQNNIFNKNEVVVRMVRTFESRVAHVEVEECSTRCNVCTGWWGIQEVLRVLLRLSFLRDPSRCVRWMLFPSRFSSALLPSSRRTNPRPLPRRNETTPVNGTSGTTTTTCPDKFSELNIRRYSTRTN